jgi:RHS repeat-associated protein
LELTDAVTNVDGSNWIFQYDNLGQVTSSKKYWADGTPVAGQQFTYNFDNIGNRLNTGAGGDASGNNLRNAMYTNNVLNQITGRDVPGYVNIIGSADPNATVTVNLQRAYRYGSYFRDELYLTNTSAVVYQALTNLAVLNNGMNADIISTNTGNILLAQTPEVFAYDADGNLTNDGVFSYSWDAENRLTNVVSLSTVPTNAAVQEAWSYLPDGRWSQVVVSTWQPLQTSYVPVSTNRFLWDRQVLLAELAPNGTLIRSYMRGLNLSGTIQGAGGVGGLLQVSYYGADTTNCFVAFDGNGNVAALVNAADGTTAANYEYDPFGQTIRMTGPMAKANAIRFSTQWVDDNIGDIKYLYRNYSPCMGKWKNRDPIAEKGFWLANRNLPSSRVQPQLYVFLGNNTLNRFDILGLCTPGCNRAMYVDRVVPDGDAPDLKEQLPEWVALAKHTETIGILIESGGLSASTLIEDAAGVSARALSDGIVHLTTPPAGEMAEYLTKLYDVTGQRNGWNAYYRTIYQTCKCRSFLGRLFTGEDGYWADLASGGWKPVTAIGDLLGAVNYYSDVTAAYKAGSAAGI